MKDSWGLKNLLFPVLISLLVVAHAASQWKGDALKRFEGRRIKEVRVIGDILVPKRRILASLRTRKGGLFSLADIDSDIKNLWNYLRLLAEVDAKLSGKEVMVRFHVKGYVGYNRFEVIGTDAVSRDEALKIMDLREGSVVDIGAAEAKKELLLARYERLGYPFAKVQIISKKRNKTLVFRVTEGPKVKVRWVKVIGNRAFPAYATLGLKKNLLGSSGMVSLPSHIINPELSWNDLETWVLLPWVLVGRFLDTILMDAEYSPSTLREDLQKLREFYRKEGYKDARVELLDVRFTKDRTGVYITILVDEGKLYRVSSVDIEHILPKDRKKPYIDKKELLGLVTLKPGMPYTQERVKKDEDLIARKYGRLGFPAYDPIHDDLKPEETFRILQPLETYDPKKGLVAVTYRVQEGYPKRLRKINIRGNLNTKDAVIRREISLHPGELLDMEELKESLYRLDALKYFEDERGASTVTKSLRSVPGSPGEVDLDIDLREGKTGQLLWSVGMSSNIGFFGRFVLRRSNFDLFRPPSTANPFKAFGEILDGEAFYGGGQELSLEVQPGTKFNYFDIHFHEPDIFGIHEERIGFTNDLYKKWRAYWEHLEVSTGTFLRLSRLFGRKTMVFLGTRIETVGVRDVDSDAPYTVIASKGKSRFW